MAGNSKPIIIELVKPTWGSGRRFRPGQEFRSVTDLIREVEAGRWIYLNKKPYHPGVAMSMTVATLRGFILRRMATRTIENKDYKPKPRLEECPF